MITGLHAIMYAKNADATRVFFKDILKWPHVDAGRGWLIFAAPPAELAAHPTQEHGEEVPEHHELFFMCDNLAATMADLKNKGIEFVGEVSDQPWGILAMFKVPGAGTIGLYEPKHPKAIDLK